MQLALSLDGSVLTARMTVSLSLRGSRFTTTKCVAWSNTKPRRREAGMMRRLVSVVLDWNCLSAHPWTPGASRNNPHAGHLPRLPIFLLPASNVLQVQIVFAVYRRYAALSPNSNKRRRFLVCTRHLSLKLQWK